MLAGLLCLLIMAMSACDDDFATAPGAQPVASVDTLDLGMVLAGNSSKTYQLKLYNHEDKELRLSSIALRHAGESGFRINVDGMTGSAFTQSDLLRIPAGDSLYLFIEATFPDREAGVGQHLDYVDVLCNGRMSSVVLKAESQGVCPLHGLTLQESATWRRGAAYQIFDSLVVAPGATLTIEDSVTLYLHDKADIIVYGTVRAQGSRQAPVTIRGDRTDLLFDNLPYDNMPSQWGSICIYPSSSDNLFEYCDVRGMSRGIVIRQDTVSTATYKSLAKGAFMGDEGQQVVMRHCRIKHSEGNLITAYCSNMKIENSELSNAVGALLDLYGGAYDITHCTLANYSILPVAIAKPAICLSNADTVMGTYAPLRRCLLTNTLVWGKVYDPDIRLDYFILESADGQPSIAQPDSATSFCYRFDHCLLRANGSDDDDFVGICWGEDPLYRLIDPKNYTFDFHLGEASPAAEAGTVATLPLLPADLDGNVRPVGQAPSIGCYQYVSDDSRSQDVRGERQE